VTIVSGRSLTIDRHTRASRAGAVIAALVLAGLVALPLTATPGSCAWSSI